MAEVPDYPSNSYRGREKSEPQKEVEQKPKLEQVTSEPATRRKKPLGKRLAESFTGDDAQTVGQYVLFDILLPAAKTMLNDAVSGGFERLLFGDSARNRSTTRRPQYSGYRTPDRGESRVSYSSPSRSSMSSRARREFDFDEIVIKDRGEADVILEQLMEQLREYKFASVADLYELVGITPDYTDRDWGWVDLRGADATRFRDGYFLNLPRPIPRE